MAGHATRGCVPEDTVSERLRRWTRNPLGSARRGSNPLGVDMRRCGRDARGAVLKDASRNRAKSLLWGSNP